jgi:asparaginyl-tRNA synthetase
VKFCARYALEHCADDLHYFEHEYPAGEKGLKDRLLNVLENDFARITYTDAVALLQSEIQKGNVKFEKYPSWGDDLGSEHERFLAETVLACICECCVCKGDFNYLRRIIVKTRSISVPRL